MAAEKKQLSQGALKLQISFGHIDTTGNPHDPPRFVLEVRSHWFFAVKMRSITCFHGGFGGLHWNLNVRFPPWDRIISLKKYMWYVKVAIYPASNSEFAPESWLCWKVPIFTTSFWGASLPYVSGASTLIVSGRPSFELLQVFNAITAAFQKMGALMQHLGSWNKGVLEGKSGGKKQDSLYINTAAYAPKKGWKTKHLQTWSLIGDFGRFIDVED